MKWSFFLFHIPTRRFLNSRQYRLHGGSDLGSRYRSFHASNSMWLSSCMELSSCCYDQMKFSSFASSHCYSTSSAINTKLPCSSMNEKKHEDAVSKVDLEIISRETIKPTFPTPNNLRIFNLSLIDQIVFDTYTPLILFFPNTNKASVKDVINKRLKHLKETLSEILTRFYPLAGQVKDKLHIECNDEGVYYIEARVNQTLEDFLCHPDDYRVNELMPKSPCTAESSIGNYVVGVQVNIFTCGGIGLSASMSHKIVDFYTYMLFMKAWAAAARGSPKTISPSFVGSEAFPNDASLEYTMSSKLTTNKLISAKRFVFDSTSLALLKEKTAASKSLQLPSRTEALTTLIWKVAAKAASAVRPFSPQSPHALLPAINLRKRASPPFPDNSIGNLSILASTICFPNSQPDLPYLLGEMRESITKVNSDFIESMKGEKGHETMKGILKGLNHLTDVTEVGDCLIATSVLNSGIYELDFGWGKPIWFSMVNPGYPSLVRLSDTLKGGGVEASIELSQDEMEIFESDPELLSYATVNPSPLQFLNH